MNSKYLFALVLVFVWLLTGCKEDTIGPSTLCQTTGMDSSANHPKNAAYQAILNEYTLLGLPGATLLVQDSHGVWKGSAGKSDIEQNVDMQTCTVSKVASITKLFVGTLTMKLVEEGKLDLDARINTWLAPKITDPIANANEVSLRQLLNHTSGIYDVISDQGFYLALLNNPNRDWQAEELLAHVNDKEAVFAPGEGPGYSNTNYLLISMILEAATGEHHGKLLRDYLFTPLDLQDTYYHWDDDLPVTTAQGYYDLYNNGQILNLSNYHTGSGNGYGGIYATTQDIFTFIQALFVEKTVLSQASLDEMLVYTDKQEGKNLRFGLGVQNDFLDRPAGQQAIGHRGRDLAYSADLFYFPEADQTFALIVNYGTDGKTSLQEVYFALREAIVAEMFAD